MKPTPNEVAHATVDTLLRVIAQSSNDLRAFHEVVAPVRVIGVL